MKKQTDLYVMSVGERMRFSEDLGKKVAEELNRATRKANKFLKKYGFEASVEVNIHALSTTQSINTLQGK